MSTLRCTNLQDTSGSNSLTTAQIYNGAAKAWVNFNGTGTVAIRAQFNVSSITDNGTGQYTVNFTTAMPDVNYAIAMSGYRDTTGSSYAAQASGQTYTVSACRVNTYNAAFAYFDAQSVSFQVFR
jgi:hypothetical protein